MSHLFLTVIFSILLFPAIFLVFIPMMPVMTYMLGMSLLYGVVDTFTHLELWELSVLVLIFLLSVVTDYSAGVLGAKYAGASKHSIIAGIIGMILGSIVLPPFGGLPALFIAVFVSELMHKKEKAAALRAAAGSLAGTLAGVFLNLLLALAFFVLFLVFSF